jgi:hypothetical protein
VEGQGGFAHARHPVDHHLGGLWGQIASQLIQFRNAGDELSPGWGQVVEPAGKDLPDYPARSAQGRLGV